ncbi:MAG: phenylalanine--tRNA ligase subunit alpha [Candidatus Aminicenantia bacterium]
MEEIRKSFDSLEKEVKDLQSFQRLKEEFLGKKRGKLSRLLNILKNLPNEDKPRAGKYINELKGYLERRIDELELKILEVEKAKKKREIFDPTLPPLLPEIGSIHPIRKMALLIEEIFLRMGYTIEEGPEIESDWYNFEALNIPKDHPARDTQDTLYIDNEMLLRTHTSPVQIRVMQKRKPPIKSIMPGRVFRKDEPDPTHSPMFFQVEGLVVDRGISFAHLKGTLEIFLKTLFSKDIKIRFRPSYFPFTEPSAEVDINCPICAGKQKDCKTCGGTGWLEVLGAGMVHPYVLRVCDIDWNEYTGFAFGLGVERLAIIKWGITDMRLFYENDLRFLKQFSGV